MLPKRCVHVDRISNDDRVRVEASIHVPIVMVPCVSYVGAIRTQHIIECQKLLDLVGIEPGKNWWYQNINSSK